MIKYLPFFLLFQELIIVVPFFAYLYMDMKNSPLSIPKALLGTGRLLLCHLPVIGVFLVIHAVVLWAGKQFTIGLINLGLPSLLTQALIPLTWFVMTYSLFFSACAMYYTKTKHADRLLLFGKQ